MTLVDEIMREVYDQKKIGKRDGGFYTYEEAISHDPDIGILRRTAQAAIDVVERRLLSRGMIICVAEYIHDNRGEDNCIGNAIDEAWQAVKDGSNV